MSLFPRFPSNEMGPLFRLLDDYHTHGSNLTSNSAVRAFQPKFDVREHETNYELQGELPGIDQKEVHIAFADPHTLVIKGRTERDYSSEGASEAHGRITGDVTDHSHKATVEDEGVEVKKEVVAPTTAKAPKYWISERSVGEFHRAFTFPSRVNQDAVKASLKNGILSVIVPKAPHYEGKRIAVE